MLRFWWFQSCEKDFVVFLVILGRVAYGEERQDAKESAWGSYLFRKIVGMNACGLKSARLLWISFDTTCSPLNPFWKARCLLTTHQLYLKHSKHFSIPDSSGAGWPSTVDDNDGDLEGTSPTESGSQQEVIKVSTITRLINKLIFKKWVINVVIKKARN